MRNAKKKCIAILAAAAVITAAAAGVTAFAARRQSGPEEGYVQVEDAVYPRNAEQLDLRGKKITLPHYEELCGKLPECQVLWDVPFQGGTVPSTTEILTVSALTEKDADLLGYFPELRVLDASQCRDYEILMKIRDKRPRCAVSYNVDIGNQTIPWNAVEISLSSGESSGEELMQRLPYLTELQHVHMEEPEISADQLEKLMEAFPKIRFDWVKTVFGQQMKSDVTFLDLSGKKFSSLQEVAEQTAYLPGLTQVDMLNCGFSNEEMKAFRDQMRDRYKVVWNVDVGSMDLRTDVLTFFPDRDHGKVKDNETYNLRYCEDLLCIDVGHLGFSNVDWAVGTPHLKYLIMSDGGTADLTPLGQLQELEFLELFMTGVVDTSPLLNCRALRDLNLCRAPLGDITPLTKMTWLDKLWVSHCPLSTQERELLKESLPNTHIEFDEFFSTWGGWRDMPRYFDMRDVLGVPYMR